MKHPGPMEYIAAGIVVALAVLLAWGGLLLAIWTIVRAAAIAWKG